MPELPEVQTIVSDLNKKIKGETITGFWSDHKKAVKNKFEDFIKEIKGRKILETERIGKNIFINLSGRKTIYIHLKMTGHLLIKKRGTAGEKQKSKFFSDRVNQYIHHIFYLGKNKTLEFSDLRKFGKIILCNTEKMQDMPEIKNLGVDVMSEKFTLKKFQEILNRKSVRGGFVYGEKKIRDILMDQSAMSGIGNIYSSEILFRAGVRPERKAGSLDNKEIKEIFKAIKSILKRAVEMRGTSDSDYRDTSGAPGGFQKALKVYRRTGEKCQDCDTIIKRIKMGQRSAFVCPKCQK